MPRRLLGSGLWSLAADHRDRHWWRRAVGNGCRPAGDERAASASPAFVIHRRSSWRTDRRHSAVLARPAVQPGRVHAPRARHVPRRGSCGRSRHECRGKRRRRRSRRRTACRCLAAQPANLRRHRLRHPRRHRLRPHRRLLVRHPRSQSAAADLATPADFAGPAIAATLDPAGDSAISVTSTSTSRAGRRSIRATPCRAMLSRDR